MILRLLAVTLAAGMLLGCKEEKRSVAEAVDSAVAVAQEAARAVDSQGEETQAAIAETAIPVALRVREAVETVTPEPEPLDAHDAMDAATRDPGAIIITRYEIVSDAYYERALKAIYCPRGNTASGPTGGVGYDFAHQTEREIRAVWGWHPQIEAMVAASGQTGPARCAAWRAKYGRVLIDLQDAKRVFAIDSLPKYRAMAMRALPGLEGKTPGHIGGVTSTGYRRGWSMVGARNAEKRVIRSTCMPIQDQRDSAECSAVQTIAMCRVWEGTDTYKGQCRRSHDEAAVIRS